MQVIAVRTAVEEELQHLDFLAAAGRQRGAQHSVILASHNLSVCLDCAQQRERRNNMSDESHAFLLIESLRPLLGMYLGCDYAVLFQRYDGPARVAVAVRAEAHAVPHALVRNGRRLDARLKARE